MTTRVSARTGINLGWLRCGSRSMTDKEWARCTKRGFPKHLHLRLISDRMNWAIFCPVLVLISRGNDASQLASLRANPII